MKKIFVCALVVSASAFAADEFNPGLGTVEVGAGGGIVWLPGSNNTTKPVAYTRVGVSLNRVVNTYGEFSYIPMESASANVLGVRASASTRVMSYGGGMQFQVPTGGRVTPYAMLGIGGLNAGGSVSVNGITSIGLSETFTAFNFGGGTKIFITPKLGVDVNLRALRLTESGSAFVPTATVGVFYQFNKK